MLKLIRLYSEPKIFDDLNFKPGLNLILGQPSEDSHKTNGVGKSVSIEFLNFALLARYGGSRIQKIPQEVFPLEAKVCLDCEISGKKITIKRSRGEEGKPTIIEAGKTQTFDKLDDACRLLSSWAFEMDSADHPSFRSMLGIFIRSERSEFKSIINGFDTTKLIPDDYSPHLYLLGADISAYHGVQARQKEISETERLIKKIKEDVRLLRQKKIDDARADLNELDAEVGSIKEDIENLKNCAGYDILEEEISSLDQSISQLRRKSAVLIENLSKLAPIAAEPVNITDQELCEFYEDLKVGLGDLVSRNFSQLKKFNEKILNFQNDIISKRRAELEAELEKTRTYLKSQDDEYQKRLKLLDQTGTLKTLKQTFATYQEKSDELSELKSFIKGYDKLNDQLRKKKLEKDTEVQRLQSSVSDAQRIKDSFERTILEMHQYVMGNQHASFQLVTTQTKKIIEIALRIDSDGSHSVEREKTFLYDLALMQNEETKVRHFGLLVHDNIFEVDADTLRRNLRYIADHRDKINGQYILTLNSDRASNDAEKELNLLRDTVCARFTKQDRFLKTNYQED